MPIEITRKGYIEVYKDGDYVSRHTSEWEAIESLSEEGDGDYEIRFPLIVAKAYGVLNPNTGDVTPPSAPGSVQSSATSATTGTTTWTASTDDVGVAGYQVFVDGVPQDTTTELSYNHTGLSPSTQYAVSVVAFDSSGNNSAAGGPALFTTDSNSAPVWALGNQAYETSTAVNIDLDAVCTDADGDTITYSLVSGSLPSGLSLSGARNQTLSGTVDTVEVANFTLGASDGIASVQNVALTFTITAPDTVAPNAPTGLSVVSTTSSTINLDWSDNSESDLNHYDVYRSTVSASGPWGQRNGSPLTSSSYQDSGLNEETQYWYYVTATDDSDNESSASSVVTDTTEAASATTNAGRISTALAGRSPHFSYSTPFDPITTRDVTVTSASQFNSEAATGSVIIRVNSSFSGSVTILGDDVDVIMSNSATITGGLTLGSGGNRCTRIRWTGGNVVGRFTGINYQDVLFDDFHNASSVSCDWTAAVEQIQRVAVLNSTLQYTGGGTGASYHVYIGQVNNAIPPVTLHQDLIFANTKFLCNGGHAIRIMGVQRILMVDCACNPDGGASFAGLRFHYTCQDIWAKDTWVRDGFKIDAVNTGDTGPSFTNALFDNFDRYADDGYSFGLWSFNGSGGSWSNSNTGTVQNSTLYNSSGSGTVGFTGYTNGGGNDNQVWDGSTVPDYSSVGAVRS